MSTESPVGHPNTASTASGRASPTANAAPLAWLAIVLTPVAAFAGFALAYLIGGWIGVDFATPLTPVQNLLVYLPVAVVMLSPPVFALAKGISAARSGSRSGAVAAVVAAVLTLLLAASFIFGI